MRGEPLQLPFTLNRAEPLLCSYQDFYLGVQIANATSWEGLEKSEAHSRLPSFSSLGAEGRNKHLMSAIPCQFAAS